MPPEAEIWDAVRPAAWAVEAVPGYDWVVAHAVDLRFLLDVLVLQPVRLIFTYLTSLSYFVLIPFRVVKYSLIICTIRIT